MYKLETSSRFDKQYKKISASDRALVDEVIAILLQGKPLDKKYKNHNLKGRFHNYQECHVKPDLLLIYKYNHDECVVICICIGSHSNLF